MPAPYTLTWDHGIAAAQAMSWQIEHTEGDFATLTVLVQNPRVGLLSGALFATLSDSVSTLFYGRLVGVPEDLQANAITLVFLACPDTYDADKAALAATLRVDPYWDPIWIAPDRRENPDAVLDARAALWHVDRVTHAVTTSDLMIGEAGTVTIDPDLVVYDSVRIRPLERPAETVTFRGEVHWRQTARGLVDITGKLYDAFAAAGCIQDGCIVTYSGSGFLGDWPNPGGGVGPGWSVWRASARQHEDRTTVLGVDMATGGFADAANAEQVPVWGGLGHNFDADVEHIFNPGIPDIVYGGGGESWGDGDWTFEVDEAGEQYTSTLILKPAFGGEMASWKRPYSYPDGPNDQGGPSIVGFPKWFITGNVILRYDADIERVEVLTFDLNADVQQMISARQDAMVNIELSSSEVDQPVDPGGALPIGSTARNSYLRTERGQQSIRYAVCLARANAIARARAVQLAFTTTLEHGRQLSLRHSATLADPRLPVVGTATGKVVALTLAFDAESGEARADVTLGCTIGNGGSYIPTTPTGVIVEPDVIDPYIQSVTGGTYAVTADIGYSPVDPIEVEQDDLTFKKLTPDTAILGIEIEGTVLEQSTLLLSKQWHDSNEAVAALDLIPTKALVELVPVTGGPIITDFPVTVTTLVLPKTIDLGAP